MLGLPVWGTLREAIVSLSLQMLASDVEAFSGHDRFELPPLASSGRSMRSKRPSDAKAVSLMRDGYCLSVFYQISSFCCC